MQSGHYSTRNLRHMCGKYTDGQSKKKKKKKASNFLKLEVIWMEGKKNRKTAKKKKVYFVKQNFHEN